MTSIAAFSPLEQRALNHYKSTYNVAREIVMSSCILDVSLTFYIEDDKHGGMQVGSKVVSSHVGIPIRGANTYVFPMENTKTTKTALDGGIITNMRCILTFACSGSNDKSEHHFNSLEFTTNDDPEQKERVIHTGIVHDTTGTVEGVQRNTWSVRLFGGSKKKMEFTHATLFHDPAQFPALINLLTLEAIEMRLSMSEKIIHDLSVKEESDRNALDDAKMRLAIAENMMNDLKVRDGPELTDSVSKKRKVSVVASNETIE